MQRPVVQHYDDERHHERDKHQDGYSSGSDSMVHLCSPLAPDASMRLLGRRQSGRRSIRIPARSDTRERNTDTFLIGHQECKRYLFIARSRMNGQNR